MFNFDMAVIIEYIPLLIQGIKITVYISLISSVLAFILGVIIVYLRTFETGPAKFISTSYVEIIRNTPLLIQLYVIYKCFPHFGIMLSPVNCGIMVLTLYTGAFISEVLRAGMNAVAVEQYQASISLGLSKFQSFRLVIFPQAIRIVIPPLGSQFINLIKNSSLVSFISVTDVYYMIYKGAYDSFAFFEFFIAGALIYMLLTGIVALITNLLENQFKLSGRMAKA